MITPQDMQCLARFMVEKHGSMALTFADQAVDELESQGEERRAKAWKALRSLVDDIIVGRMDAHAAIVLQ
ncbi:MAG: hypothetical protein ACFB6R_00710 [Alphaproteobacteria bacterium]